MRNRLYEHQFCFILVMIAMADIFAVGVLWNVYGSSVWAAFFFAIPLGALVVWMWFGLISRKGSIFAAFGGERIKWLGAAASWAYGVYFVVFAGLALSIYGAFVSEGSLIETSPSVFVAPLAAVAVYGAAKGERAIGRAAVIFGSVLALAILISAIFAISLGEDAALYPIAGDDSEIMVRAVAFVVLIQFGEMASAASFIGRVEKRKTWPAVAGAVGGCLVLGLFAMGSAMAAGHTSFMDQEPIYRGAAEVAAVLSSMKVWATAAYLFGAVFRAAVNILSASECFCILAKGNAVKKAVIPIGAAAFVLSIVMPDSFFETDGFFLGPYLYIAAVMTVILPLLASAVSAAVCLYRRHKNLQRRRSSL